MFTRVTKWFGWLAIVGVVLGGCSDPKQDEVADSKADAGAEPERLRFAAPDAVYCKPSTSSTALEATDPSDERSETPDMSWDTFVEQFTETYFEYYPTFAVAQGRHEYDGRLPDWSPNQLQKLQAWLEGSQRQLCGRSDGRMSETQRFQREYVRRRLESELFYLRDVRAPFTTLTYYTGALDPNRYVVTPYAPLAQRARAFIEYARRIPAALQQIRANLDQPLAPTTIAYGSVTFSGFVSFYRNDVPLAFAGVDDSEVKQQLTEAIELAATAMFEMASWINSQTPNPEGGYAMGPERFSEMLERTEGVTTPLDELEAIGREDLERNRKALAAACQQYLPDATIEACVTKVAADKPAGGAVEEARSQLERLRKFVEDRQIVSIPGSEQAQVAEAPSFKRTNIAYIDLPGPYEKTLPAVYYIASPSPDWSAEDRAAYVPGKARLLFITAHEVWPGHFLQFQYSNRSNWLFGRTFVGYAFVEGWAHYTEELMREEGLADGSPDLQIGSLIEALVRNVRFECSFGLHTHGMTLEQCQQLFKEVAYQDPGNSLQQSYRGALDPGYLNYTMGKLMIRKLRADWLAENRGRPLREFHDATEVERRVALDVARTVAPRRGSFR
jgi:uncharacterized protein (DUF885 family)